MHLTILSTGGTIFQKLCPTTLQMGIHVQLQDLISSEWLAEHGVDSSRHIDLAVRSGAELKYRTVFAARDAVESALNESPHIVLVTGTDTLDEFAFCLDLLVGPLLVSKAASLIVTGSMKPFDVEGYDGKANLQQAVQVATCRHVAGMGVLVSLNDSIHLARYVFKADSQLMGAFASHPGPVGQIREGKVRLYYGPPPDADGLADPRFASLNADRVEACSRVGIWVTGVEGFVPEGLLREVCGLVVAAPGTGSLSTALIDTLAPWTARIPIVLVSRCTWGNNYDDHYYRGSKDKYEQRGFLLSGFEHMNAMQARTLLIFRIAAGCYPLYTAR